MPNNAVPTHKQRGCVRPCYQDRSRVGGYAAGEVLRWALGRIREHPAYPQIQARVREISGLKTQF
jgi:hypothetical protein